MFRSLNNGARNISRRHPIAIPRYRQFHATAPRHIPDGGIIDGTMQVARELFKFTHDSVLWTPDWMIAIPLTTLALRLASYAITDISTAKQKRNITAAKPFVTAATKAMEKVPKQPKYHAVFDKDGRFRMDSPAQVALWKRHNDFKQFRQAVKLRYGATGLGLSTVGLVQIPLWLVLAETLRSMSGTTYGLIGLIKISLGFSAKEVTNLHPEWIEPSMATESFMNILVPDPTGFLSITLGGLTVLGGYRGLEVFRNSESWMANPILKNLVRIGPFLGLLLIPMTMKFPAALLLFWVTSSFTGLVRSVFLPKEDKKYKALTSGLENLGPPPTWLLVENKSGKPNRTKQIMERRVGNKIPSRSQSTKIGL